MFVWSILEDLPCLAVIVLTALSYIVYSCQFLKLFHAFPFQQCVIKTCFRIYRGWNIISFCVWIMFLTVSCQGYFIVESDTLTIFTDRKLKITRGQIYWWKYLREHGEILHVYFFWCVQYNWRRGHSGFSILRPHQRQQSAQYPGSDVLSKRYPLAFILHDSDTSWFDCPNHSLTYESSYES